MLRGIATVFAWLAPNFALYWLFELIPPSKPGGAHSTVIEWAAAIFVIPLFLGLFWLAGYLSMHLALRTAPPGARRGFAVAGRLIALALLALCLLMLRDQSDREWQGSLILSMWGIGHLMGSRIPRVSRPAEEPI